MRRPLVLTLAGLAALSTAGIALAHNGDSGSLKTAAVAATFTAAPADNNTAKTCTGADGTYIISRGAWTGTAASSNDRLKGPLLFRGEMSVNQTTGSGWLVGRVGIDANGDGKRDAGGDLRGVIAGGKLTGFLSGQIRDGGYLYGSVVATVGSTGLTDGQIGGGSVSPAAILIDRGACTTAPKQRTLVDKRGTVSAVSATSITVTGSDSKSLTCVVGADFAATVAKLKVGDSAALFCALVDGSYRVLRLESNALEHKPFITTNGTVTAVSSSSLTVSRGENDSATCVVGADFADAVSKLKVGDKVAAACAYVDGSYRIVKLVVKPADKAVVRTEGTVSAISATSITFTRNDGSLTCVVGSDLAADVAKVSTGQKATATCGMVDGSYRLLALRIAS